MVNTIASLIHPRPMLGIDTNSEIEDTSCVVYEGKGKRAGSKTIIDLWGRGVCRFECEYLVSVKSVLLAPIKHYGVPQVIHTIFIDSPDNITLTIYDGKRLILSNMTMRTVEVSGRVLALRNKIGYSHANNKTVEVLKSLGLALKEQLGVLNTKKITTIRNVGDTHVDTAIECPCCGNTAILRYSKTDLEYSTNWCELCGWNGFLELYDGAGSIVSLPKTTSVRNKLKEMGIRDGEGIYEQMFNAGIKPSTMIRKLNALVKIDRKEARRHAH